MDLRFRLDDDLRTVTGTETVTFTVHEVAHMWFYGMVGNSQFRDPWLDEAFATYAEAVVNPTSATELLPLVDLPGDVGDGMADFSSYRRYATVVYGKGAAALLTARKVVGPEAFDAAIRCHVDANAWAVATPADVGAALAAVPEAVAVLDEAGALGTDDVPR